MRLFSPIYAPWGLAATALMVFSALLEWGQATGAIRLGGGFRFVPYAMIAVGAAFVVVGAILMYVKEGPS